VTVYYCSFNCAFFKLSCVFCFSFCKVVDGNVSSGSIKSKHLSQVTSLTSSYDVAWRKHDFAKYVKELSSLKVTIVFAVCSIKS